MTMVYLDFEKPVSELEKKIAELAETAREGPSLDDELNRLREKVALQLRNLYADLDPWQKTQVARHPERPHFSDYRDTLFEDWVELAGDRKYMDDRAILGGMARFRGRPVMLMGHEKGRATAERIHHNFGMARPEGYRKTARLMELAQRFGLPVIALIDTAGAYPGRGGEERGQAEAIARSMETCLTLETAMVSLIIGEGASGGAVALAAGNRVLMMENAIYTVITPEGAASILFRDSQRAADAAAAMKIVAEDLEKLSIVDKVIEEPVGGAHRDPDVAIARAGDALEAALDSLAGLTADELRNQRKQRFYRIGRNFSQSTGDTIGA